MKYQVFLIILCFAFMFSCNSEQIKNKQNETNSRIEDTDTNEKILSKTDSINLIFINDTEFLADGFDFPVGKIDTNGYYNAQKYGLNFHLGEDWNSIEGGNTDLGDPIYSIANGYVNFAKDIGGGWGKVVRICHKTKDNKIVESLYAHCDSILVKEGDLISKGQQIATIGTANGYYIAHLHFEIRNDVNLPIGSGYSSFTKGYLNPTKFINSNR
jgi:murein DD-endopeptidase MepM/ murein hydrolase activator NlpD